MSKRSVAITVLLALLAVLWFVWQAPQLLRAQRPADKTSGVSCAQYIAPKRNINGKMVGEEECLMLDRGTVDTNRKLHRIDMGFSGTLSGYIVKQGPRPNNFTSAPDFTFTQVGNHSPRFQAVLKYEAAKGTAVNLMYPETGWNGKLFVMVHGRDGSFMKGTLRAWDKYFDPGKPLDATKYEQSMLDRGYAVARTWRNADGFAPGDFSAVLEDGTTWPDLNVNIVPELILDEVRAVDNLLKERLGRRPTRNYWYGHSAGAQMGLAVNYMSQSNPNINKDADGRETISGFINDDPGLGLFIPVLRKNGQDVLYRTAEEKAKFVKSFVLDHQMNPDVRSNIAVGDIDLKSLPEEMTPVGLTNKRTIARIFRDKGVENVRVYEVRGVSHMGGETLPTGRNKDVQILNLSRIMDGIIDLLDNWVEKGSAPPRGKSDVKELALGGGAIDPPENACPLGQYYPFPRSGGGGGNTGFMPYDGKSLEPLDGNLIFADMNKNGVRDKVEAVTEAWRRLGLLKSGEKFNRDKYVACVQTATAKLRKENMITEKVANDYLEDARKADLPQQ